jgi:hypothetical protein
MDDFYFDRDGKPISQREWALHFGDLAYKHVAITAIGDDIEISTVWIGINHRFFFDGGPPLIFETLVFGGPMDGYCWRWHNEDAARLGHEQVVERVHEAADV